MQKIALLGAGRVGYAIACDLASSYIVTAFDIDNSALSALKGLKNVHIQKVDLQKANYKNILHKGLKRSHRQQLAKTTAISITTLKDLQG